MAEEMRPEGLVDAPRPATFNGSKPSMARHWPTPPGGWPASLVTLPAAQPPPTGPPPTGRFGRRMHLALILSIVGGVVLLACLGGAVTIAAFGARSYHREHQQAAVGMYQPVRDGSFQFTADAMRCGVQAIGSPDEEQSPLGQFCVITLTIMNVGSAPALFAESIQEAFGAGDVRFSADATAALYANPDPTIFQNLINPGNTVRAVIVYDIPRSGRIMRLEVHENPSTRGAVIKIS
jgi:MFS family permease